MERTSNNLSPLFRTKTINLLQVNPVEGPGLVGYLLQIILLRPFPGARIGAGMAIPVVVLTTGWLWRQTRRLVAG